MAFESSQLDGMQRSKKIRSTLATAEHSNYLKSFLAMLKDQTTSSILSINYCHGHKEGFEILTSSAPTNNHHHGFKEGLETLTSSTLTNNHCYSFREGLETQLISTTSTSFVSDFDIPENTSSNIEPAKTGYALQREHCWPSEIKDSTLTACNLCKYI